MRNSRVTRHLHFPRSVWWWSSSTAPWCNERNLYWKPQPLGVSDKIKRINWVQSIGRQLQVCFLLLLFFVRLKTRCMHFKKEVWLVFFYQEYIKRWKTTLLSSFEQLTKMRHSNDLFCGEVTELFKYSHIIYDILKWFFHYYIPPSEFFLSLQTLRAWCCRHHQECT